MPSLVIMSQRKSAALSRIELAVERLSGQDVDLPDLNVKVKGNDPAVKEMLLFERLADWLDALAPVGVSSTDMPLEYLTTDGLRWIADQRGLDVSEVTRKQDLIEVLEG